MKHELTGLCQQVAAARDSRTPLRIQGGNTKSFYGEPAAAGTVLNMSGYSGIINYEPSELVITARAGTLLSDIEKTIDAQGQMLAFEPPRFGPTSTLGGCVASGLSGPRRMAAGALGDFILGARLLDSAGNLLSFGGEVMKNVAGYDVSRLLAGSLGSLGPIVEVSVKVLPKPACEQTQCLELDESGALERLNQWRSLPLPISASVWRPEQGGAAAQLMLRLSGSAPAVESAVAQIGGDTLQADSAAQLWAGLRDQTDPFFQARPLWRLAVPPTTPTLGLGDTLIEWNGGQRWLSTDMDAGELRRRVADVGGHATLYRYLDKPAGVSIFHSLPATLERINRRMMEQLDPVGIFNPGRRLPAIEG